MMIHRPSLPTVGRGQRRTNEYMDWLTLPGWRNVASRRAPGGRANGSDQTTPIATTADTFQRRLRLESRGARSRAGHAPPGRTAPLERALPPSQRTEQICTPECGKFYRAGGNTEEAADRKVRLGCEL